MTRAVRAQLLTAPRRLELVETAAPDPSRLVGGQVLLRVLAGGICGSDLPFFAGARRGGRDPGPGFPMHEVVGEVVATRAPQLPVGARVVGWAAGFDGMSEAVIGDAHELHVYDPALDPVTAVVLQPLACALYALDQVSDVRGRDVAVLGFGAMGALFTTVLHGRGTRHVTVVDPVDRTAEAPEFGADEVVTASAAAWAADVGGDGPDLVVEAVGHQDGVVAAALTGVRPGGEVYAFGVPEPDVQALSLTTMLRKNLTLRAGVTLERATCLAAAERLMADDPGLAGRLVTDRVAFEDVQRGFERAAAPAPGHLKVVMEMS